jgi:hypothetical protein
LVDAAQGFQAIGQEIHYLANASKSLSLLKYNHISDASAM